MTSVAMADNGRVLIPAELREELGLKPKTRFHVEVRDGSLVLTPLSQHYANLRAYLDSVLKIPPGVSLSEELIAERRLEAKREAEGE
jgi:AbrB family looped-hinge helix DNA binding protein